MPDWTIAPAYPTPLVLLLGALWLVLLVGVVPLARRDATQADARQDARDAGRPS